MYVHSLTVNLHELRPFQLLQDLHMYPFSGTVPGVEHSMAIDNVTVEANYLDLSSTTIRRAYSDFSPSLFVKSLSQADGIVLLYDMTSLGSFENVISQAYMYARTCNQYMADSPRQFGCEYILVGNKKDITDLTPEQRQVDKELAEQWAQSQGMKHVQVSSLSHEEVEAAVGELLRSIQRAAMKGQEEQRSKGFLKSKIKLAFGRTKSDA